MQNIPAKSSPPPTLIVHDYVEQTDGGSRLCLELGRALGADFMCGFIKAEHPFLAEPYPNKIIELSPANPPLPLLRQWLLARAFQRARAVGNYQRLVYSGSYAPLAVPPKGHRKPGERHICYCHTPPRFAYDQHAFYLRTLPLPARPLFKAFCAWLRPRYEQAIQSMDLVLTNSRAD